MNPDQIAAVQKWMSEVQAWMVDVDQGRTALKPTPQAPDLDALA